MTPYPLPQTPNHQPLAPYPKVREQSEGGFAGCGDTAVLPAERVAGNNLVLLRQRERESLNCVGCVWSAAGGLGHQGGGGKPATLRQPLRRGRPGPFPTVCTFPTVLRQPHERSRPGPLPYCLNNHSDEAGQVHSPTVFTFFRHCLTNRLVDSVILVLSTFARKLKTGHTLIGLGCTRHATLLWHLGYTPCEESGPKPRNESEHRLGQNSELLPMKTFSATYS